MWWHTSSRMRRRSITDGYVTLMVSLTVTLFLSLILAFFQSAGVGAAKMRAECVTEIAIESVLAEYHRVLFDRYGLLMIDTSYGSAVADVSRTEERLRHYVQNNFSPSALSGITDTADFTGLRCSGISIPVVVRASDANGAVLRRQILLYMRAEPVEDAFANALDDVALLRARGYDTHDVAEDMDNNYQKLQRALAGNGLDESAINETVSGVHAKRHLGILPLTHPSPSSVSRASIIPADYISVRGATKGNGNVPAENLSAAERLLIDQYLFETCGCYTSVREGSRLSYQIEYLIAGKPSDYANLESIASTLLFWREASNFAYIMTDEGKTGFATALAMMGSILIMMPEMKEVLKMAILFAWSFAESVSDVRTLFEGGRVPLVKTAESWKLDFASLLGFRSGGGAGSGLDYAGYLRMMLLMTDLQEKTWRFMDIVEMDIRNTPDNGQFRLDGCLEQITAHVSVEGSIGFSGTFIRTRGYVEEVADE